jgi:uncharacterized protein
MSTNPPPNPSVERRSFPGKVEIRAAPEGSNSPGTICGYAAVFNSRSEELGGFYEVIAPGCFTRALRECDIRALRNHDPESLLGRLSAGTLSLSEDAQGLRMEVVLPDTTAGRDTAESVRRGDMTGCSFSFQERAVEWNHAADPPVRTLRDVDLFDVGPVTFPAYRDTSVALRSLEAHRPAKTVPLDLLKTRLRLDSSF